PPIARRDAEDTLPRREAADQTAEDQRRVVAIREAVHHADGALRAAVARIRAERGERQALERRQLARGGLDQEPDLPVAGVIAERDRPAVGSTHAALRAEDQVLRPAELARIPAHPRVLREPEDVAARTLEQ